MSSVETPLQKQCRIKSSVVLRIQKELVRYQEELQQQKAKIARMRADAEDEYVIKKQVEVQGETEVMVPDTMRRLGVAVDELEEFVAANAGDAALADSEQLRAATGILTSTRESGAGSGAVGAGGEDDRI